MAYEFKRLSDVEEVETFPENGKVLLEDNGEIKKCPTDGLGGGGISIAHAIFNIEKSTEEYEYFDTVGNPTGFEPLLAIYSNREAFEHRVCDFMCVLCGNMTYVFFVPDGEGAQGYFVRTDIDEENNIIGYKIYQE